MPALMDRLKGALPLSRAAREYFPIGRSGNPLHKSTLIRWHLHGLRNSEGQRVRLGAFKIGTEYYTDRDSCERFLSALNQDNKSLSDNTDREMSQLGREASKALEAMGI